MAMSALIGLSTVSLSVQNASAQTCGNLLSAGPIIQPISGSKVLLGQTINITSFRLDIPGGDCFQKNGVAYYADPKGVVTQTLNGFSGAAGTQISCTGTAGGGGAACLPFPTTYVVAAADINRTLTIVLPPRGQYDGSTEQFLGQVKQIHFFGAGDSDGFDPADQTTPTGAASGTGRATLTVVRPCITITKNCAQPCTAYGQPIAFNGTICNTGDTVLGSIEVTDTPPAGSTDLQFAFAPTTSLRFR
jgi:hypothetical protein